MLQAWGMRFRSMQEEAAAWMSGTKHCSFQDPEERAWKARGMHAVWKRSREEDRRAAQETRRRELRQSVRAWR